jgi:hypothetical protein
MTTPVLNGQLIGQAQIATGALLERILARTGTTFHQWVAINVATLSGGAVERAGLIARMTDGLRIEVGAAEAAASGVVELGLAELDGERLVLTEAGRARHAEISADTAELTGRLYGGIEADDLAVAGRVLAEVTARAQAELRR